MKINLELCNFQILYILNILLKETHFKLRNYNDTLKTHI